MSVIVRSAEAGDLHVTPRESVDLASLGNRWAPPRLDATAEVSEVLTTMPSWAARGLLYLVVAFSVIGLGWAHLSQVDIVAEARGVLVPEGYVRPVHAVTGGVVQAVRVREGSTVTRGQMLVQLDAKDQRARLARLREELATCEEQFRLLVASRHPGTESLEKQNRITQLKSEITAAEFILAQTTITAPGTGVITRLNVTAPGTVIQPGVQIAAIAPAGARLIAEAQLPNKDLAFVRTGRTAQLKIDAFPFQEYGGVTGKVIAVAPDAQLDDKIGSFYKVTIELSQSTVIAKGERIPLRPGLTLTAEIITERKSILAIILEPIRKLKGELKSAS
jgi:multidrug efflux pump subunit AcrA (membrane-fusion protein)